MDTDNIENISEERDNANGMPSVEVAETERNKKGMCGHVTTKTNQIHSEMVAGENAEQVIGREFSGTY